MPCYNGIILKMRSPLRRAHFFVVCVQIKKDLPMFFISVSLLIVYYVFNRCMYQETNVPRRGFYSRALCPGTRNECF